MKEKLIAGAWYKSKYNDYFKFEKTENGWNYHSEKIINKRWSPAAGSTQVCFCCLEDLIEIQEFLPPNHPDLFTNKPIQNENLDYLIELLKSNNIT